MRFQDRRRGGTGSIRRRVSPLWGRRRYSPGSPIRRRRSPSFSPRRRRTPPSPYTRRISRSRSPIHPVGRSYNSPRSRNISGASHLDHMGSRHMSHHDMHRQAAPVVFSPRGHLSHRGQGDSHLLPRHSPGPVFNKSSDMPPSSHGLITNQPGPSVPGPYSPPSSSRKKHKKEKKEKHRKHKKSKKHRSPTRESKKEHKKHKKHKKTKKHKSH